MAAYDEEDSDEKALHRGAEAQQGSGAEVWETVTATELMNATHIFVETPDGQKIHFYRSENKANED